MDSGKVSPGMQDASDQPIFSAVITPHRSLGRDSTRLVLTLCCIATVVSSIPFVVLGAWPVAGFLGLDLVALFVAFHLNFRAARSVEEVVVTRIELLLARISPGGKRSELRFNPLWTRLDREIDDEFGLRALFLVSGERRVAVGGELSPPERESFAEALSAALARVKNGR